MPTQPNHTIARSLGALAVVTLASCSLPSEDAWRQIQSEGLLTYMAKPKANEAQPSKPSAPPATQAAPVVAQKVPSIPAGTSAQAPSPTHLSAESLVTAQPVPGLAGYVRSPFTNPPRLVDVRNMAAGSKVVCPYTRKAFLVPNLPHDQQMAAAPTPAPLPKPEATQPAPAPQVAQQTPVEAPTKVAVNTKPAPQAPPTQPQVKPMAPPVQQTPPPAVNQVELPFGLAIPGRPGFVNSPYAAKHQLVDVTGLPTGMEVKCPYSGKLFRVPPQAATKN